MTSTCSSSSKVSLICTNPRSGPYACSSSLHDAPRTRTPCQISGQRRRNYCRNCDKLRAGRAATTTRVAAHRTPTPKVGTCLHRLKTSHSAANAERSQEPQSNSDGAIITTSFATATTAKPMRVFSDKNSACWIHGEALTSCRSHPHSFISKRVTPRSAAYVCRRKERAASTLAAAIPRSATPKVHSYPLSAYRPSHLRMFSSWIRRALMQWGNMPRVAHLVIFTRRCR